MEIREIDPTFLCNGKIFDFIEKLRVLWALVNIILHDYMDFYDISFLLDPIVFCIIEFVYDYTEQIELFCEFTT